MSGIIRIAIRIAVVASRGMQGVSVEPASGSRWKAPERHSGKSQTPQTLELKESEHASVNPATSPPKSLTSSGTGYRPAGPRGV